MATDHPASKATDRHSPRIGVIGGGVGTGLLRMGASPAVAGRGAFVDVLCELNPGVVGNLHRLWLSSGVDWLVTNSFLSHPLNLARFGWEDRSRDLAFKSASIARGVVDTQPKPEGRVPLVVGSVGPLVEPPRERSPRGIVESGYVEFASGLLDGGVDMLCLESFQETATADIALEGCRQALDLGQRSVPIAVSFAPTFLAGDNVSELAKWAESRLVDFLGLNCGSGPEHLVGFVGELAARTRIPLIVYPNAGLPEMRQGRLVHPSNPTAFVDAIKPILVFESVVAIGGCCGAGPEHFRALAHIADSHSVSKGRLALDTIR